MFRKVTVFSLQGGWEARWKREADAPAMTHVVQNLCPGGYSLLKSASESFFLTEHEPNLHKYHL